MVASDNDNPESSAPTVDPNDSVRPRVALARIGTTFNGDPLDKTVGNWKVWLGSYIKEGASAPDAAIYPIANKKLAYQRRDGTGIHRRKLCYRRERTHR